MWLRSQMIMQYAYADHYKVIAPTDISEQLSCSHLHEVHTYGDHVVTRIGMDVRFGVRVFALVVAAGTLRSLVLSAHLVGRQLSV